MKIYADPLHDFDPEVVFTEDSLERAYIASRTANRDLLEIYANDPDMRVRREVAGNSHCSPEILEELSFINDGSLLWKIAGNPQATAIALDNCSYISYNDTAGRVVRHPNTSAETLDRMLDEVIAVGIVGDRDLDIRWGISGHPNTSADTLTKLADDPSDFVRWEVAKHVNTPEDVLLKLAKDDNKTIRTRAQVRLGISDT